VFSCGRLAQRKISLPLMWVDRSGRAVRPIGPPGLYRNAALSPDARRVAVDVTDPQTRTQDIWLVDLSQGFTSRFTFDPANDIFPTWSPDGNWVMFGSDRNGVFNLYQKRANGGGTEEPVLKSTADMTPSTWTSRTPMVLYRTIAPRLIQPGHPASGWIANTPLVRPVAIQSAFALRGARRALDCVSVRRIRQAEVWLQSFPATGGGKWLLSKDGGLFPRWGRAGREVIDYAPDGRLMAVPIAGKTSFAIGTAAPLFEPHLLNGPTNVVGFRHQYDVTRDGQRFLLNVTTEQASTPSITVVLDWTAALRK
jgi:hypothetical protein